MTGWRALLRVARRDVRRHRGRSLLIVLLVALPVAAMTLALVLGRTAELTPDQRASGYLGQADLLVDSAGVDPGEWQEILPAGSRWVRVGQDFDGIAVVRGDELFRASAFETELGGPLVAGRWQLVEGRAAAGGDELVVSPDVAGDLGVAVGDRLELRRPRRTVTVTGIAIMPTRLGWPFVVVPPGWWSAGGAGSGHDGGQWLVDVGGAEVESVVESLQAAFAPVEPVLSEAFRNGGPSRYLSVHTRADLRSEGSPNLAGQVTITYVVGALALAWTGAVAAAAFAVGARRRLREVGLVAAAGGGPRQLRGLLLADGAVLGAWGATAGVGLGLAAAAAMRPHLDRLFDHVIGPLRVPVLAVVGAATVGALAAILAAVAPARGAARVPVLAALAGTRPPRPRTRSWLAVGAVALAVGLGLCWRGGGTGSETAVVRGVLAVVGLAGGLSEP
ncbi:MAG: FtsX-like permease family protein, partial [Acidimicrobiales bacterium]